MRDHPFVIKYKNAQCRLAMAEVREEATVPLLHKKKLVMFFSSMRHFAQELRARDIEVSYIKQAFSETSFSFVDALDQLYNEEAFTSLDIIQPGDKRVELQFRNWCIHHHVTLNIHTDPHFLSTDEEFEQFAATRKKILLEHFYRQLRKRLDILMDDGKPLGGKWNYDHENRESFGKNGPPLIPPVRSFSPDPITVEVMEAVDTFYKDAPGSVLGFDYPVTHEDALLALEDFLQYRLEDYGRYQDAMSYDHAYLFHSRISAVLNLHLLDPRACIEGAVARLKHGAPLNAVEGFVRQILGWREFVRGIYHHKMPDYAHSNALGAVEDVPKGMWGADTPMACVRGAAKHVVDYSYTHHIERLMVLGLYAMLFGAEPMKVHQWHMAMYIDAIDWVSMPNVLGMSQYADDGYLASKPYAASGAYIKRMSNYCSQCVFKPSETNGTKACPMTLLYWDFLNKHEEKFKNNPRMSMQLKNLGRKTRDERRNIEASAEAWRAHGV